MPSLVQRQREIEIGRRLRKFRESFRIPRTSFALSIGISGDRLASYESGRVPLRYQVFLAIFRKFGISPFWLATNEEAPQLNFRLSLPSPSQIKVSENAAFSEVYPVHIAPLFLIPAADPEAEIVLRYQRAKVAAKLIEQNFIDVPDGLVRDFEYDLDRFIQEWFSKHQEEGAARKMQRQLWYNQFAESIKARLAASKSESAQNQSKDGLDIKPGVSDNGQVSRNIRSLPDLVEELRKRTKLRGQKAALARKLGVTRQAIDQWLSRNANPSAEIAFKLLQWIEQRERQ